jgi:MoxR-like ATPase
MKERIKQLLQAINNGIYEKEQELALSLLAAIAGESIILLGPPGVAKSMIARRVKAAFSQAHSFEYLMSRFSTPDEIFGPVSISKLKDSDNYERKTKGYLPSADVVFLDEIWKAGPAIQNTLLTAINEKLFRNGEKEIKLPLKLLIAASNELPTQDEGLEALWDRFLIRVECKGIQEEKNFCSMLIDTTSDQDIVVSPELQISKEEYERWSKEIDFVTFPTHVLKSINQIRQAIKNVAVTDSNECHDVYVSDRRWKKIARLLRTSAFIHGRQHVALSDLAPIYLCLWQEPDERNDLRSIVIRILFSDIMSALSNLRTSLDNDIRTHRQHKATARAQAIMERKDGNKKIYDHYYYHLLDHDTGNTYILMADYQNLPIVTKGNAGAPGILYPDPKDSKRTIIRAYDGVDTPPGTRHVHLARSDESLFIDGVRFYIETLKKGETQVTASTIGHLSDRDYHQEIDALGTAIREREQEIEENIFLSKADKKEVGETAQSIYTEIAYTRYDIQKLEDE